MGPITPDLADAIESLANTQILLVALDFDGTLAPLVDRPEDARPLPAAAEALTELSKLENTITALISGRDLASLRAVGNPPEATLLVGSHGTERWAPEAFGAEDENIDLSAAQESALAQATSILTDISAAHPKTTLEYKPASIVLHVRQATPAVASAALRAAHERLEGINNLQALDGKAVLEASVLAGTKGDGLNWLREVADASTVIFAGDDVTDEDAFAALRPGDIGVKIGSGKSKAQFRLNGPGELPALLEMILDMRSL
ncbi:MAG: trehalose-phosphatase [Paeniglutamicibacter terrestris]|uniref:Trehalose 6-phosphate phosphatase n=1 Tax=Paeniglutamicibacter terrestris TaxID=2723403 RepID=A0ABX1G7D7_9MICC|nr:trehalose-phosphatase [Paeniglutamicibacter terrestris]ASN40504.1 trehalose-phosphatase [Arthrobacter sp. 7749]NKG21555.1 trehalose-phosphatase [Paeniglutamicibacter terrestris]